MIHDQFTNTQCASLQKLAVTKNYRDVLKITNAYSGGGSAGDCNNAIGAALEEGQKFPVGTPIWLFFLNDYAVFFIGDEPSVRARINALP